MPLIMQQELASATVQNFIRSYQGEVTTLALKGSPFPNIQAAQLIQQIVGYRKTKQKLPTWHDRAGIFYPPKLNIEQTSSEVTAHYKTTLVEGKTLADLTGGYGVDAYFFAKKFKFVDHFEQNEVLSEIASFNFDQFEMKNISCFSGDSLAGIKNSYYDVIFVDPARRHETKGKVFFLSDCEPNLVSKFDYIMERCETLLIKTSPMLDLSVGLSELKYVTAIHIVALDNEVKELLWVCKKTPNDAPPRICSINLKKENQEVFEFQYGVKSAPNFHKPMNFLYEPNAAILKSGGFNELCARYDIYKLHKNSHLYTSEEFIEFPGRSFKISNVIPYSKEEMRTQLSGIKANVTIRNFLESVQQLRKKWSIKDGGDRYLFFTTSVGYDKVVIDCSKL